VIWEGKKAVKIVEKEDKENERWTFKKDTGGRFSNYKIA
jgi:hypothetical protein